MDIGLLQRNVAYMYEGGGMLHKTGPGNKIRLIFVSSVIYISLSLQQKLGLFYQIPLRLKHKTVACTEEMSPLAMTQPE